MTDFEEYERMRKTTGTRPESEGDPVVDPLSPEQSYGMWQKFSPSLDFIPRVIPRCFDEVVLAPVAQAVLVDPRRDTLVLRHILVWSLVHLPSALLCLFWLDSLSTGLAWALAGVHLFEWFTAMDTYVLGLHVISHRKVFKGSVEGLIKFWYVWVLGPIFGETPETYYAHHIGMHHSFNNGLKDLSSTAGYRRDSKWQWFKYLMRFIFCHAEFFFLMQRRNPKIVLKFFGGELSWLSVVLFCAFGLGKPFGTFIAMVTPVLVMRVGMMAGNWGQHAFLNPSEPFTNFGHSVNIVGSSYNKRCFNDGYHIMHHLYPNAHYTELPLLYARDFERLKEKDCIVFKHPHWDFTALWFLMLTGQWDTLASHVVDLGHGRSHEQTKRMLQERASKVYLTQGGRAPSQSKLD
eukprot:Hpha_TRINITY_DN3697_c0_g1::TRINITY_DN3697_c0_g1_i1::g.913::m.913